MVQQLAELGQKNTQLEAELKEAKSKLDQMMTTSVMTLNRSDQDPELQRFVKSVNHVYIDINVKSNLLKVKLKMITEMWPELDKQAASGSVAKNGQFI